MTWRQWLAPVVTVNVRQAARIRRQAVLLVEQDLQIHALAERLRRIQDDVELMACCIPRDRREDALALVRDRHRIEALDTYEEAGHGNEQ